jgi:Beta xylosidase C-terminal Concanavalin A-like domain
MGAKRSPSREQAQGCISIRSPFRGQMTLQPLSSSLDGTGRVCCLLQSRDISYSCLRTDTPLKLDYSLTVRSNCFRLYGGPYNLSIPACPTLFLRKQTHRFCTWETRLSFHPSSVLEEAGTVVWWNYFTYSSIGIRKSGTTRVIRFREAGGEASQWILQKETLDVVLRIVCGSEYSFGFCEIDHHGERGEFKWVGEVSNRLMTRDPPIGFAFTGMMLGLYSFAELQRSLTPADFSYVTVKDL